MRIGGLVVWAALVGCGGASTPAVVAPVEAARGDDPSAGANGNGAPDVVVAEAADGPSTQTMPVAAVDEILVSGHGFTPQPVIRSGTAGAATGGVDGSSLSESCVGTFPSTPSHVIKLGGPIGLLRVVVDSDGNDLTLAIRTPDGVFHCNDDSGDPGNGLNPTVELFSPPPGTLEVWVGTYSDYYTGAQYRLGVTEQPGYASDLLRH